MDEAEAERLQALLAAIVGSSDDAIVSKNLNGVITSWNRGAERLFGYTASEAVGRSVTMLIPVERFDEEPEILARIRHGERIEHYETVRRRKDGTEVHLSLTVSPIIDSQGRVIGASKIARDISDRKAIEIAQREAVRRKDEFLATLAHELRNPLAPIRNGLHVFRLRGVADPELQEIQQMMERQVGYMSRLVDDLIEMARIDSGKIELVNADAELAIVLNHAVETCRPALEANNHVLELNVPDSPLVVHGDEVRLTQIFANLLDNAAKYTPPRGTIKLTASGDGANAVVSIKDNGVGISPEMLPVVFDMFAQAKGVQRKAQSGLGIGLQLVQKLVTLHDGTVEARSAGLGHGSEFVVRLPQVPASASLQNVQLHTGSDRPLGRMLIVDDNQDAANALASVMRALGVEVRVTYDGQSALALIRDWHPTTVVLDIGMPGMDGYQVAEQIVAEGHRLTLIALTGWGQKDDERRSREAGFDHHLVKPVDAERLLGVARGDR